MSETKKRVRCLVFSRVVGYYQPVTNWNIGKQQEYKDRVIYDVAEARKPDVGTPAVIDADWWTEIYPDNAPDENGARTIYHRTVGGKGVTARALAVSHD